MEEFLVNFIIFNFYRGPQDYFQHQTTTRLVLSGTSAVVQLDYRQKVLLVSTRLEALIVLGAGEAGEPEKVAVGRKNRKSGRYGGVLRQGDTARPDVVVVRPNNRIWLADSAGLVGKTVIFKSALDKSHSQAGN